VSWFPYVLAVVAVLFAFSTIISWSYYGVKAWTYLVGEGRQKEMAFNSAYCVFVVIGAAMSLGAVIDFTDAAVFSMALFNIAGLYVLMPVVKAELNSYLARLRGGEFARVGT
jgi:AGCS family alanine or glycine:cation symporter